jgi:hypothetical protein
MYIAMTKDKKIEFPGFVVLVPSKAENRDGCIWCWQLNPARLDAQSVSVFSGKPVEPKQPIWDEHFLDTADLLEAVERNVKDEVAQLINEQLEDKNISEMAIANPSAYICAQLASGLFGAQFVIWWRDDEGRLDVGIYCDSPRAAAYARLLSHGAHPFPVGKCPECGKRFIRSRWHPQMYCSTRCRNTHNVRKSRQRKRNKRKHLTRKKPSK